MILIVTQTFAPRKGGMEYTMTELAAQFTGAGHPVIVLADGEAGDFVPPTKYDLQRFCGPRFWRRWQKKAAIRKIAGREKVEAIFCDSWKSVEALPRKKTLPIIVLAHGAEYPENPAPRKAQRIAAALARSGSIVANSRYTADLVRPYLPFPDDARLTIIHPTIAPPLPPSEEAQKKIMEILGGRGPVLSTIARLEPRKGIDRVIGALPDLIQKYPTILFLIGGIGEDKKRLESLARNLGVEKQVIFLGRISDDIKSALLDASAVFAMPVRREGASVEGFGLSYIEAAWFGVPALGGTKCGAADAVIDGETGLLCDGASQVEVTNALLRLLGDEALRRRWGRAAQLRAQSELSWGKILPRYLALFVLGSKL